MKRAQYTEIQCKSAMNIPKGMPFGWSLNPYRGCRHACRYCYAVTTHAYLGYDVGDDFSTQIHVKVNVAEMLRTELARRTWKRETVVIGSATDPYQPAEGKYRLTRRCLQALADFRTPASIITKGTLIVRDIDVLQTVQARGGQRERQSHHAE